MERRYNTIEFLRIIFSICVIIGHTYCVLFRIGDETLVSMQNMSVDAFFIISGIFLANTVNKMDIDDVKAFGHYQIGRVKRLFPVYFFVAFLTLIYRFSCGNMALVSYWNIFLLLDGISNFPTLVIGAWYVGALFWIGLIVSYVLFRYRKKAVVFHFPVIIFVTLSIMYSWWDNLSLNQKPYIGDWLSAGCLKAILGLSIGIELFYLFLYLQEKIGEYKKSFVACAAILVEIISTVGIAYCFVIGRIQRTNYYIYFFLPPLVLVFLLGKEHIFKFANGRIWGVLGTYTYAVYLIHPLLLDIIKQYINVQIYNQYLVYVIICFVSFILGIIVQEVVNKLEAIIKKCIYVR